MQARRISGEPAASLKNVGNRLYKIRYVAGYPGKRQQGEFAARLDINPKSYSQYETGTNQLPIDEAIKICEAFRGVTLDYIYRGGLDFLTPGWQRDLKAAPDRP